MPDRCLPRAQTAAIPAAVEQIVFFLFLLIAHAGFAWRAVLWSGKGRVAGLVVALPGLGWTLLFDWVQFTRPVAKPPYLDAVTAPPPVTPDWIAALDLRSLMAVTLLAGLAELTLALRRQPRDTLALVFAIHAVLVGVMMLFVVVLVSMMRF